MIDKPRNVKCILVIIMQNINFYSYQLNEDKTIDWLEQAQHAQTY